MNDQLQQALAALLTSSVDAVQAGVNFLQAELPDVIQQLLVWQFVSNLAVMVIPLLVLIASTMILWRAVIRHTHANNPRVAELRRIIATEDALYYAAPHGADAVHLKNRRAAQAELNTITNIEDPMNVAAFVASGVTTVVSATCLLCTLNLTWLQIWLAPKIYLIEYAARLAK